jgi:hypothetical protein
VEPTELLGYASGVFERLGVAYAVVGSVASSFFGEARFTNDVDIVADLRPEHVPELLKAFPPDQFYLSEDAVREALRSHREFNIIHPTSGLKVDVIVPAKTESAELQFARRRRVRPRDAAFEAYFASPEDVILKKLYYFQEGGSDKHLRDIAGILKINGPSIDRTYITHWAERQNLVAEWTQVQERAATRGKNQP